jgi:cellulose 1,4-beta-cellobiosidase
MKLVNRLSGRRRVLALAGASVLVAAGLATIPATAANAAVACQVTYQKAWDNGSGFGANITINNTGDPLNGWSLTFTWPGNQNNIQGWSANWSQVGQNVTATSLDWNANVPTGGMVGIGFNASYSGANTDPSNFAINGTACNGGGTNQAPTVSLTSPASGQTFAAGASVPLAANASDPDGTINRVEFRVDGNLVGTDTSSPYTASATGLASGTHTAQATAFDNGSPALSTNSTTVSFTVGDTTQQSITATPASQTLASGASGTVTIRRSAAPTSNVTVTIARTGSTVVTCTPTTVTLTPTNWSTGVNLNCAAAAGTTAATSNFTASATGHTAASFTVSRSGSGGTGRVNNPYEGAGVYNNPDWRAAAQGGGAPASIYTQATGVWLDRIAAITSGSAGDNSTGLADHLNNAVQQDAANGATPMVIQIVIYNLPGRDCSALASNGELGPNDLPRYQSEYIDVIAEIMARPAYANLRIVAIIEIDSLPNLVTNLNVANCATVNSNGAYVNGVGYALDKLGNVPNVYNYIDAAHHGWIGWSSNFGPTAEKLYQAANANGATPADVHGFITNTANYSALTEPYINIQGSVGGQPIRQSSWIDWNDYNDEQSFAAAFRNRLVQQGFNSGIGMLIDTSRNGWGGAARPTGPSSSTVLNTFVDESRTDRRIHKGNWCNQSGAGLGERPLQANGLARANPATGIDAYVWIKPPGESDGSSSLIPNDEGKGFDRMCDPTYGGNERNGNNMTGALANAPISGHWFQAQFQQLMQNANPPIS